MPSTKKSPITRLLNRVEQPGPLGEQIGNTHAAVQISNRSMHGFRERFLPWARRLVAVIGTTARRSHTVDGAHGSTKESACAAVKCLRSLLRMQGSTDSLKRPKCLKTRDRKQMSMFAKATAAPGCDTEGPMHFRDIIDVHMECEQTVIDIFASGSNRPAADPFICRLFGRDERVHGAPHHGAAALSASSCPRRMRMRSTGMSVPESMPGHGVRSFAARHDRALRMLSPQKGQVRHCVGRAR